MPLSLMCSGISRGTGGSQRANGRLKGFPRYIRVRRVVATREPWTVESGLLTPTLKVKRERVQEKFRAEIERAYAAGALD